MATPRKVAMNNSMKKAVRRPNLGKEILRKLKTKMTNNNKKEE